jgi:hypothetical protein
MTPDQWAAEAARAKDEYERESRELTDQLERARAKIARLETRLAAINEQYRARITHLGISFLGLPAEEPPHQESTSLAPKRPIERRRGAFDEPVLGLARELASPDVTSRQIEEVWNQRHPDNPIRDSTMRSILERLEEKKLIRTSEPGGGKGSGIPRKYRPVEPAT